MCFSCDCDQDAASPTHVSCGAADAPEAAAADGRLVWGFQQVSERF